MFSKGRVWRVWTLLLTLLILTLQTPGGRVVNPPSTIPFLDARMNYEVSATVIWIGQSQTYQTFGMQLPDPLSLSLSLSLHVLEDCGRV
jgi:hypothetical protein